MSTQRIMPGLIDYAGTKAGTLDIGQLTRRSPEPVYSSSCRRCGAHGQSVTQSQLRYGSAFCRAAGCGKAERPTGRDLLREQKRIAAELEAERLAAARDASARRIEAEVGDYQRPERHAPTPEPRVMTQRERDSLREFREAEEAEQRAADAPRIEAERKQAQRIAELQEEQEKTLRQLHTIEAERIATGRDETFTIDPATVGPSAAIPTDKLDAWHASQSTQFLADNPSYFACKENEAAMLAFIERNAPDLKLLSAAQLMAAYRRLRDFGLLRERPAPVMPTEQPKRVNHTITDPPKPKSELVDGWDLESGEPRQWTPRELDRLSSTDYRRALRLYKADLELPNIGPGSRPR